ncbi:hypothetical protein CFVI97532_07085 [Campylobacter fetus subsp. venerealis cfvi97/532]|nr:hypothetical protein CFVI97532_07085 [Campylobacter fetus subsp. venerealis cfvi97/532]
MIISVINEKGGSGKTTIAINLAFKLASEGLDIMLIDADPQRSVEVVIDYRVNNGLELPFNSVSKTGDSLAKEAKSLASKYDSIIIDTGGRDSKEMRQALLVSDIVLIPTIITSGFDQAVLNKMINLLDEASIMNPNLKALIVNNKASTNPMLKGKNDKYIDFLKEIDLSENIKLADTILYEREIYKNVVFDGKSVIEVEGDNKAKNEISSLYNELLEFAKNTKETE